MAYVADEAESKSAEDVNAALAGMAREEVLRLIASLEEGMAAASESMDFERAASLRDQIVSLKAKVEGQSESDALAELKKSARKGSAFGNRKNAAYGSSRRS